MIELAPEVIARLRAASAQLTTAIQMRDGRLAALYEAELVCELMMHRDALIDAAENLAELRAKWRARCVARQEWAKDGVSNAFLAADYEWKAAFDRILGGDDER